MSLYKNLKVKPKFCQCRSSIQLKLDDIALYGSFKVRQILAVGNRAVPDNCERQDCIRVIVLDQAKYEKSVHGAAELIVVRARPEHKVWQQRRAYWFSVDG